MLLSVSLNGCAEYLAHEHTVRQSYYDAIAAGGYVPPPQPNHVTIEESDQLDRIAANQRQIENNQRQEAFNQQQEEFNSRMNALRAYQQKLNSQ
jgi:hypothetical protein